MYRPWSKLFRLHLLFLAASCLFLASHSNAALSCCRALGISESIRLYCFHSEPQGACYGRQTRRDKKSSCCRWRRNGEVLNAHTGSELIINNATLADYGNYSCSDNEELFVTTTVYPHSCHHGKHVMMVLSL